LCESQKDFAPAANAFSALIPCGLGILSALARPGRRHSSAEIAAWCGCSPEYIKGIEARALAKLNRLLRKAGVERESVRALLPDLTSDARRKPRHGEAGIV
jgi:hypothetical protein